jgi:hypothetical protein
VDLYSVRQSFVMNLPTHWPQTMLSFLSSIKFSLPQKKKAQMSVLTNTKYVDQYHEIN